MIICIKRGHRRFAYNQSGIAEKLRLIDLSDTYDIIMKKAVDEDRVSNTFKDKTSAMLDKDDFEGVIKYCNKKLEKYPKEMYAHWYLAQAYYRKKEYHRALEELTIISEITPSWKEHYVDPYVAEIKE